MTGLSKLRRQSLCLLSGMSYLLLFGCERGPKPSAGNPSPTAPATLSSTPTRAAGKPKVAAKPTKPPDNPMRLGPLPVPEPPGLSKRPLVAVYERDPWATVIGSDVPSFVLYADGSVITSPRANDAPGRVSGKTSQAAKFAASLSALLRPEPERTSLSLTTDQANTVFLVRTDAGWVYRSVYGMTRGCKPTRKDAKPVPTAISSACSKIETLSVSERRPWAPQKIEVMLWGFEHSRLKPKPWPASLPALPPGAPPKSGVKNQFMDAKHRDAVKAFLASLQPRQAVAHAGHKWSVRQRSLVPADAYLAKVRRTAQIRYARQFSRRKP